MPGICRQSESDWYHWLTTKGVNCGHYNTNNVDLIDCLFDVFNKNIPKENSSKPIVSLSELYLSEALGTVWMDKTSFNYSEVNSLRDKDCRPDAIESDFTMSVLVSNLFEEHYEMMSRRRADTLGKLIEDMFQIYAVREEAAANPEVFTILVEYIGIVQSLSKMVDVRGVPAPDWYQHNDVLEGEIPRSIASWLRFRYKVRNMIIRPQAKPDYNEDIVHNELASDHSSVLDDLMLDSKNEF
jgi:hypothetical protein